MSQCNKILEYLKQGHRLTPLEGLRLFGTMRLGARCWDLRKAGYDVRSRMVKTDTGKHIAQYYLYKETQQVFV